MPITITVTGWKDVKDYSVRGYFTVYTIECTASAHHHAASDDVHVSHRRFSEWRQLHIRLRPGWKFPSPKRLSHSEGSKIRRADALERWLRFSFARAAEHGNPPDALLEFVGISRAQWQSSVVPNEPPDGLAPSVAMAPCSTAEAGQGRSNGGRTALPYGLPPTPSTGVPTTPLVTPLVNCDSHHDAPCPPAVSLDASPSPGTNDAQRSAWTPRAGARNAPRGVEHPLDIHLAMHERMLSHVRQVLRKLWARGTACLPTLLWSYLGLPPLVKVALGCLAVVSHLDIVVLALMTVQLGGVALCMLLWALMSAVAYQGRFRPNADELSRNAGSRISNAVKPVARGFRTSASIVMPIFAARDGGTQSVVLIALLAVSLALKEAAETSELGRWAHLGRKLVRSGKAGVDHREWPSSNGHGSPQAQHPSTPTHDELHDNGSVVRGVGQECTRIDSDVAVTRSVPMTTTAEESEVDADSWVLVEDDAALHLASDPHYTGDKRDMRHKPRGRRRTVSDPPLPVASTNVHAMSRMPSVSLGAPGESGLLPASAHQDLHARAQARARAHSSDPAATAAAAARDSMTYMPPHRSASRSVSCGSSCAPSRPQSPVSRVAPGLSGGLSEATTRTRRPSQETPALASPLLESAERLLDCLPHELRTLARPIATELLVAGKSNSLLGFEHIRALVQAVGVAASIVLSRALLDPDGRMRLWLGLKALADSSEMEGRLPEIVSAFTRQRHAFELGMRGSLVLQHDLQVEHDVPLSRLFTPGSSPPARVEDVQIGDVVRVRYPYKPDKADLEEGLFLAVITAVRSDDDVNYAKRAADEQRRSSGGGGSSAANQRGKTRSVDIRYTDEVNVSFGDQPEHAGLNVLDQIQEVGATWRLWARGLSVDVSVPSDPATSRGSHTGADTEASLDPAEALANELRGMKTISVDWQEPSAAEREAGVFGSLAFTIELPVVHIHAGLKAGRFWSDSVLLKLGRFNDVSVTFDEGQVHARLRISIERDGAYLAFESLSLAVQRIRIDSISDHSRRWGFLLGTVTGLQWLLSGFLERKLLDMIATAVVAENKHQRIVAWTEIPLFRDFNAKVGKWQVNAARRELRERRAVKRIQEAWRLLQQRRADLELAIGLGVADHQWSPSPRRPTHRRLESECMSMGVLLQGS